jgi:aspartate/tyrosine/aromatic aminotransferase
MQDAGLPFLPVADGDEIVGILSLEELASEALDPESDLGQAKAGDVVVLHGCCHNPTGANPDAGAWRAIADVLTRTGAVPLIDLAYQGFGDGLDDDAVGLRALAGAVDEMFVCTSYSKNFSLYNERVGALTVIAADADRVAAVQSHIKAAIRANYSNPPAHGAAIVATILADPDLTATWQDELATMRQRINGNRKLFVDTLKASGASRDFSFITAQRGMFSFSGLNRAQVDELRQKQAIYIVGSGRINVAGMTEANMDRLCRAIVSVL